MKKRIPILLLVCIMIFMLTGCETVETSVPAEGDEIVQIEEALVNVPAEAEIDTATTVTAEVVVNSSLVINELCAENRGLLADEDGDYSGWVELYNAGSEPVELKGWYLTNKRNDYNRWMFSDSYSLGPDEYLVIYLSGKDKRTGREGTNYHTNFSLTNKYNTLYLFSPDIQIADALDIDVNDVNRSRGRDPVRVGDWDTYKNPTPGEVNSLDIPKPVFTLASGFYQVDGSLSVTAEVPSEEYTLRYTVNDGVTFDDADQALNRYDWTYPSNADGMIYTDGIELSSTSVVKARYYQGLTAGPEAVFTYFINEEFSLPVISLTADPAQLWDDEIGIYAVGDDPENPNYMWDGVEIPSRFTYFDSEYSQNDLISEKCDLRIFGSYSRGFPNKSLAIINDGRDIPNYFFENNSDDVYSMLLRTGSSDFPRSIMRDMVTSELTRPLDIDRQDYQQTILFLNGQFWGISNIREKVNEEMIEDNYLIPAEELDIVFSPAVVEARNGTVDAYEQMFAFASSANLHLDKYYQMITQIIDIDNFIDYVIVETFINNSDWPANNVKAWKSWEEGSKWRWILYDTDASYDTEEFWSRNNIYDNKVIGRPDFNAIDRVLSLSPSHHAAKLFQNLMLNDEFKKQFIERYEELVGLEDGKIVNPDALLGTMRLLSIIDELSGNVEPYIQRQIDRWKPEYRSYMLMYPDKEYPTLWHAQVDILRDFAQQRPQYIAQFLEELQQEHVPVGLNLVENGDFERGNVLWNLLWSAAQTRQTIVKEDDQAVGRLEISEAYTKQESSSALVSFVHDGIALKEGSMYELSFRIRSEKALAADDVMLAYLFESDGDYSRYAKVEVVPTTEWMTITYEFTMDTESNDNARIQFRAGRLPGGTVVYIDDVVVTEIE